MLSDRDDPKNEGNSDSTIVLGKIPISEEEKLTVLSLNMKGGAAASGYGKELPNELKISQVANDADVIVLQDINNEILDLLIKNESFEGWIPLFENVATGKSVNGNIMLTLYNPKKFSLQETPPNYLNLTPVSVSGFIVSKPPPAKVISVTLKHTSGKLIDLHNVWGDSPTSKEDADELEEEFKRLLTAPKDDRTVLLFGKTNMGIAPISHEQATNFTDGGFYRDSAGKIIQIKTSTLDFKTGKIVTDDRTKEQIKPHQRQEKQVRALTLDHGYTEEKNTLAEFLGQDTFDYQLTSNGINEKQNSITFNNHESYEIFKSLMTPQQQEEAEQIQCGLVVLIEPFATPLAELKLISAKDNTPILIKNGNVIQIYRYNPNMLGDWDVANITEEEDKKKIELILAKIQKNSNATEFKYTSEDLKYDPAVINVLSKYHPPFRNTAVHSDGRVTLSLPRKQFTDTLSIIKSINVNAKNSANDEIKQIKKENALKGFLIGGLVGLIVVVGIAVATAGVGLIILAGIGVGLVGGLGITAAATSYITGVTHDDEIQITQKHREMLLGFQKDIALEKVQGDIKTPKKGQEVVKSQKDQEKQKDEPKDQPTQSDYPNFTTSIFNATQPIPTPVKSIDPDESNKFNPIKLPKNK